MVLGIQGSKIFVGTYVLIFVLNFVVVFFASASCTSLEIVGMWLLIIKGHLVVSVTLHHCHIIIMQHAMWSSLF